MNAIHLNLLRMISQLLITFLYTTRFKQTAHIFLNQQIQTC